MEVAADALVEAIRSAFAGVPRGSITLHEAEVIDAYGTDAQRRAARRRDMEKSWEEVPDSAVAECPNALSHLDPEGWRYYLPAYMIWSIRHLQRGAMIPDCTIYALALHDDAELRKYMKARFRLLDSAQSRATCLFLRHMAANDRHVDGRVATQALHEFWGRFGDDTT